MRGNLPGPTKPSPTATPFIPSFAQESSSTTAHYSMESSSSSQDLQPIKERVNLPPGRVTCKFYMKGYCSRGSTCWYAHDAAAVPIPMIVEDGGKRKVVEVNEPKGKEKMKDPKTSGAAEDDSEDSECCAICFESPTTYGLLTNCDHVFCLCCIRSWRSAGSKSENAPNPLSPFQSDDGNLNKTSKTCPLCRVRSKFIVPSSIFPTPQPGRKSTEDDLSLNPAKEAIVQRYLDKLGTIPCRYFQDSLNKAGACRGVRGSGGRRNDPGAPFCPFGNECHYAHMKGGEKYTFSDRELSNHRRSRAARDNRNRASIESMVFGRYAAGGRHHPLFHGNGPDAQAFIEMILDDDRSDWEINFDHFRDDSPYNDELDRYEIDEHESLDIGWSDHPDDDSLFNVADLLEAIDSAPPREGFYHGGLFENGRFNGGSRAAGARDRAGFSVAGRGNRFRNRRVAEGNDYLNNLGVMDALD